MSKQYKKYIDKLVKDADKGNTKAAQELLDEAAYWSAKNKKLIEDNKQS